MHDNLMEWMSDVLAERYGERPLAVAVRRGYMSDTAAVELDGGRRVFKVFGRGAQGTVQVRFSLELQAFLGAKGYPTPKIVPALNGQPFVEKGDKVCALLEFVEGQLHTPGNVGQLVAAARRLAEFHDLASQFQPSEPLDWPPMAEAVFAAKRAELADVMAAAAKTEDPLLGFCDLRRVEGLLAQAEREFAHLPLPELPQRIIHGDYRAQNLLFAGDTVTAVLDFDFARPAQRLFDLAYALVF
ncbi:MAG: hypothetical protein FJ279_31600, partial [Planctomycetes bacterium]|nr:hypothetical protein [Planctomycetota bacterium]